MKPHQLSIAVLLLASGGCAIDDPAPGDPVDMTVVAAGDVASSIDLFGADDPLDVVVGADADPGQPPIEPPVPDGLPAPAGDPAMDWDGQRWFLVWSDSRSGDADIYGAHVDAQGNVDPPTGIPLIAGPGEQREPDVAWNGGMHALVFSDTRAGYRQVRVARILAGGTVLDPGGMPLGLDLEVGHAPAIAASNSSFQVVWEGPCPASTCATAVRGQRFSSSGARGPAQTIAEAGGAPDIAWNGSRYLVAWSTARADRDVAFRAVLWNGELGATRELAGRPGHQLAPVVAADDSVFLLAWREDDAIVATRVADGVPIDKGLALARSAERPALSGNGFGWTIVTSQHLAGETQLHARALQRTGLLMDTRVAQRLPAADIALAPCAAQSAAGALLLGWQGLWDDHATVWSSLSGGPPFLVSARSE